MWGGALPGSLRRPLGCMRIAPSAVSEVARATAEPSSAADGRPAVPAGPFVVPVVVVLAIAPVAALACGAARKAGLLTRYATIAIASAGRTRWPHERR